jgi:hypothetical protein
MPHEQKGSVMDWVIWVVVIVLIIAIVWWLMSRGSTQSGAASPRAEAERTAAPADSLGMIPGQAPPSAGGGVAASAAAAGTAGLTGVAGASAAAEARETGPGKSEDDEEAAKEQPTAVAEPSPTELGEEPPMVDDTPRPEDTFIAGQVAAADDPAARTAVTVPGAGPATGEVPGETEAGGVDVDDWETGTSGASADVATGAGTGNEATVDEPTAPGVTADDVVPADPGPGGASASPENEMADRAEWEATWSEDSSTPTHHHEYTDPHTPTLPGAESAAAEAAPTADDIFPEGSGGGHLAAENPYGEGSAAPAPDGSGPEGYVVKGDAESMTYHDEDTPGYDDAKAGVWFLSAAHAEAAGFRPPRRNRL